MEKQYNYKVYTPNEIAKEMVKKGLNLYFENGKTLEKLMEIKICDLSCGSGNLIIPALEELILISKEMTGRYIYNENWITGYDINEEAIKVANLKIKELLKDHSLDGEVKLKVQNGLFVEEKFNVILGNPPYLGEKNNKEVFQSIKNTEFGRKYYEGKMDFFYFFIERAVENLEENGVLIYLTTNYWLKADSGKKLREALKINGNFKDIVFYDNSLFSKAKGQHNIIFTWRRENLEQGKVDIILPEKRFSIESRDIYDENSKIILADRESREYNERVKRVSNFTLGDIVNINQGIVSGFDKAFVFDEFNDEFKENLKPFYKNKDVGMYKNNKNSFWILYLDRKSNLDNKLENYLKIYYDKLSQRREVQENKIKWWQLQWARDEKIFLKPKILVRQRCKTNQFSYDEGEFYGSADIYFITAKDESINLFYILGYMNSSSFLKWFKYNGKTKGKNYEFYSTPLKETPIYYPQESAEIEYIEKLVKEQIKNYKSEIQEEIDNYFIKIFE